jgi:hypothetical protein
MRQREKLNGFMSLPHALKRFFPSKTMVRFKVTVNEPATFAPGWPQQSFRNNKLPGGYSSGSYNIGNNPDHDRRER